ncbi:hypothetical protein PQ455_01080 [Sphingomonas naphthae]|uniref:Uncharacterized protein n=1 Tax=Sphingomonas naphthae TaxID=1813468 RepID=A0ABY7TM71_9SPHN|nr:hypothetical protein [Sphingomonas naphthae]WCT73856.1 hypothetical protein PQ455_01080 [Sphingomonas naphthae]
MTADSRTRFLIVTLGLAAGMASALAIKTGPLLGAAATLAG